MTPTRLAGALVPVVLLAGLAACDTNDGRQLRAPTSDERAAMPTTTVSSTSTTTLPTLLDTVAPSVAATLTTDAPAPSFELTAPWADGGAIPTDYTCDGAALNPVIGWTAPPAGTVELAVLATDLDAQEFAHYAVVGLAPAAGQIGGGPAPTGAREGVNGFGETGWGAPCPPPGEAHEYRWTVYALTQQTELPDDFTGPELAEAVLRLAFDSVSITGTYARAG